MVIDDEIDVILQPKRAFLNRWEYPAMTDEQRRKVYEVICRHNARFPAKDRRVPWDINGDSRRIMDRDEGVSIAPLFMCTETLAVYSTEKGFTVQIRTPGVQDK